MSDWRFELVPAPAIGTKATGNVDWADPLLAGWEWPYVAVNGISPGPAVLVTAGVHGSEYVSIDAAVRLGASLNPRSVKGQVLCLPVMNPSAFWERTAYVSPVDNLNLNRVFPGKPKGTFSERVAHCLVERAVRHADAFIDLHGGDIPEALVPFNLWYETGNAAVDEKSRRMAEIFGAAALITQRSSGAPVAGLAYATAAMLGVPAMIAEDGGAGQYESGAALRMLEGVENVLRSLDVLDESVRNVPPPRRFDRFSWVRSREAGFLRSEVKVGDEVAAGKRLGVLVDFYGQPVEELTSPDKGQILFMVVSAAIQRNGIICGIGVE
jgi:predicted deacylase